MLRCGGVSGSLWDSLVPGPHGGRQWVSLRSTVYREICQMHESDPLVAISGVSGSLSTNITPLWTQQALASVTCRTWPSELQAQPLLLWEMISFGF